MSSKFRSKPASEQEIALYTFIGESVCMVQHVEDALSHSIVLRKVDKHIRSEAEQLLGKQRSYTLGKAISIVEQANLYSKSLLKELREFLSERNWLIHKSIAQDRDEWDLDVTREQLLSRIKAITTQAQKLLQLIEEDMMNFAETNGVDMSWVRKEINKYYFDG